MRRFIKYISVILMLVLLFAGCTANGKKQDKIGNPDTTGSSGTQDNGVGDTSGTADVNPLSNLEEQYSFRAEVIEGGGKLLIAPSEDSNEVRSSDKMSVNTNGATLVNDKGESITLDQLGTGDIIVVTYNGIIAESYPAQITATKVEKVGHNNLLEGYLALIDDIYQEDAGLNSEIDTIALDTTQWIQVTKINKEMIFAKVKEAYGYEVIEGTYDELAEQGLIDKENLSFPKGILIQIKEMEYNSKKETITCGISKWRSGLGAIGAGKVTAVLKDGVWKITKEDSWIS